MSFSFGTIAAVSRGEKEKGKRDQKKKRERKANGWRTKERDRGKSRASGRKGRSGCLGLEHLARSIVCRFLRSVAETRKKEGGGSEVQGVGGSPRREAELARGVEDFRHSGWRTDGIRVQAGRITCGADSVHGRGQHQKKWGSSGLYRGKTVPCFRGKACPVVLLL